MADQRDSSNGFSRRQFLGRAAAAGLGGALSPANLSAQARPPASAGSADTALVLVNGRIHTMDQNNRVVSQALIRNGRFAAVGNSVAVRGRNLRRVDLKGKTVIPGLIDAHNHIVLVGNRPGWHTPLEHVFTIPDAIAALKARSADVPPGEFITTIGPVVGHAVRGTSPADADGARRRQTARSTYRRRRAARERTPRARPGSKRGASRSRPTAPSRDPR